MVRLRPRRGRLSAAGQLAALAIAICAIMPGAAAALPAFAAQTGLHCNTCHIGGFGPQLTPFGRTFKLRGYTTRTVPFSLPLTGFATASYVRTARPQPSPPAPHYATNDNLTPDQASLFLAGGWGHFGAFAQATWDGVARSFHWDNLDLRAVTTAKVKGVDVVLGADVNNAPTVQDAFNTLAAWGFPYTSSTLAPAPAAAPLIGTLAQNTLGVTAYAWVRSRLYLEAGGYQSPGVDFLRRAGVDPFSPGSIRRTAPYARAAYQRTFGTTTAEVGAFAFRADLFPGRDRGAAAADRYTDLGLDASLEYAAPDKDVFTLNSRYVRESERWAASQPLGLAEKPTGGLNELRLDGSYYWRNRVGLTLGGFDTWGSSDRLLYSANRAFRPDSSGLEAQLDATPFGGGSPLGDRFNLRLGLQYTRYFRFDGARRNFDGLGRNASDDDTLRAFVWVYY